LVSSGFRRSSIINALSFWSLDEEQI